MYYSCFDNLIRKRAFAIAWSIWGCKSDRSRRSLLMRFGAHSGGAHSLRRDICPDHFIWPLPYPLAEPVEVALEPGGLEVSSVNADKECRRLCIPTSRNVAGEDEKIKWLAWKGVKHRRRDCINRTMREPSRESLLMTRNGNSIREKSKSIWMLRTSALNQE